MDPRQTDALKFASNEQGPQGRRLYNFRVSGSG